MILRFIYLDKWFYDFINMLICVNSQDIRIDLEVFEFIDEKMSIIFGSVDFWSFYFF